MKNIFNVALLGFALSLISCTESGERTIGLPEEFKAIKSLELAGAPILGQPTLITGKKAEVRSEKHGLAYPTLFDWNKDGKRDLLVGEFETGETGSNIKVYLNNGSDSKPKYSGEYTYATDIKGDTITAYYW